MTIRFQPDTPRAPFHPASRLIDPEAYDASEQEFAASLEAAPAKFETRGTGEQLPVAEMKENEPEAIEESAGEAVSEVDGSESGWGGSDEEAMNAPAPEQWRQEVAARLNQYRARRRPKAPRYPSLQLDFGPSDFARTPVETRKSAPVEARPAATRQSAAPATPPVIERRPEPEPTARVIEFPRPTWEPVYRRDELAEPIFETPRILEVPETPAAPPALGGILLEPEEKPALEKRPGFEIPLQPAPLWRRWTAAGVDLAIVGAALAGFAKIFYEIARVDVKLRVLVACVSVLGLILWAGYQFLLLVYSAGTPGLRLARLQVCRFDGSPAVRRVRRWRVLAAALSAAALGLGYAWSLLDEDGLCWHDRITRTYLAPAAPRSSADASSADES